MAGPHRPPKRPFPPLPNQLVACTDSRCQPRPVRNDPSATNCCKCWTTRPRFRKSWPDQTASCVLAHQSVSRYQSSLWNENVLQLQPVYFQESVSLSPEVVSFFILLPIMVVVAQQLYNGSTEAATDEHPGLFLRIWGNAEGPSRRPQPSQRGGVGAQQGTSTQRRPFRRRRERPLRLSRVGLPSCHRAAGRTGWTAGVWPRESALPVVCAQIAENRFWRRPYRAGAPQSLRKLRFGADASPGLPLLPKVRQCRPRGSERCISQLSMRHGPSPGVFVLRGGVRDAIHKDPRSPATIVRHCWNQHHAHRLQEELTNCFPNCMLYCFGLSSSYLYLQSFVASFWGCISSSSVFFIKWPLFFCNSLSQQRFILPHLEKWQRVWRY